MKEIITKLAGRIDLSAEEAERVFTLIMSGEATQSQIGAILMGLRSKGETIEEIATSARIMRRFAEKVTVDAECILDTCGTGGDMSGTFNISTTAAFVAAGAGIVVVKHGNRAISSASGSADLFTALGIDIEAPLSKVERAIREAGIGFVFAPKVHTSMRHVGAARRELGIRTIFNLLGPLTNPALATHQLIGIYDSSLTTTIAEVLGRLGTRTAYVVAGYDGLDEVTTTTRTKVSHLSNGHVTTFDFDPAAHGFVYADPRDLKGGTASENALTTIAVLSGEKGPRRDIVVLNSGFAIAAARGIEFDEAILLATESIDSGRARQKLDKLREAMS